MNIEGELVVSYIARDKKEEEKIREAISMVKGVKEVAGKEACVIPMSNGQIVDRYIQEIDSPDMPPILTGIWIRSRLPGLGKFTLRDWVDRGYVKASLPYSGRGPNRPFTHNEAKQIGFLWYCRTQDIPAHIAALGAEIARENMGLPLEENRADHSLIA